MADQPYDKDVHGEQPSKRHPPRSLLSNNWRQRDGNGLGNNEEKERNERSWNGPRRDDDSRAERPSRTNFDDRKPDRRGGREAASTNSRWENRRSDSLGTGLNQSLEVSDALAEGRRIYVGNMFYHIRPEQLTQVIQAQGFGGIDQIHLSIDPVTGRNPGYCFVEFETREVAEAALEGLAGVPLEGRPLKTGPCKPDRGRASRGFSRGNDSEKPTFERWGNWTGRGEGGVQTNGQGPIGAEEHLVDVVQDDQRCRVYVGGLDRMINQSENDKELRAIFQNFKVIAVSKRITPHESTRAQPGRHHYAFVDLETKEEANAAIEALNGQDWRGSRLKVQMPSNLPRRIAERGTRWNTRPQEH